MSDPGSSIRGFPVLAAAVTCAFASPAPAQVVLDGTLGRAGALAGPNYAVTADLGRQVGANLFHSFSQFGLSQGQSATFSGPTGIANVISRVTGGGESVIDGLLRSTIPGADFYFFNPAGVAFGPNASIDVGGAFHASTAHFLRFADGGRFDAANPGASALTAAAPEAFGFLGGQGMLLVDGSRLSTRGSSALTLAGGDVGIGNGAWLRGDSGTMGIAAVSGPGEVAIGRDGMGAIAGSRGTIIILGGHVATSGGNDHPAGAIRVVGGDIAIAGDASITASNYSETAGGGIALDASGLLMLSGAFVSTTTWSGRGAAGDIRISAPRVVLEAESSAMSNSFGPGRAGNVDVSAQELLVTGGSRINATTWDEGDAGSVRVEATRSVVLEDSGNLSAASNGTGRAGDIVVRTDQLSIDDGFIHSNAWDRGNGGSITLEVGDLRLVDGFVSASSTSFGTGDAGDVTVRASRSVTIEGFGGGITTSTFQGRGGNIQVTSPVVSIGPFGSITSSTMGPGNAGNIRLDVGDLTVLDFAYISADVSFDATGSGGSIDIHATGTVTVASGPFGGIDANTLGAGNGGNIRIEARRLDVLDGSVDAVTQGTGNAGSIAIRASERVLVDAGRLSGGIETSSRGDGNGGNLEIETPLLEIRRGGGLAASTGGPGYGGSIRVLADRVTMAEGGEIRSYTLGSGHAGSVEIRAGEIVLSEGSQILAFTGEGSGAGGDVILRGDRLVRIAGEGPPEATTGILATSEGPGAGGNVVVSAPRVEISDVGFLAAGTYADGRGGSVTIEAGDLVVSRLGFVDVSSFGAGNAGSLRVNATASVTVTGSDGARTVTGMGSNSFATGAGGTLSISAPLVILDDGAVLSSVARSEGRGGSITVAADELRVLGGAAINAGSEGTGAAGNVSVEATRRILVQGEGYGFVSGIAAESSASGPGGQLTLSAPVVEIRDRGLVTAQSFATGEAGSIRIAATDALVVAGGASIATETVQSDGGNIAIDGRGVVQVSGGSITTSVQGGAGNGGNISISAPQHVVLNDGRIQANAYGGSGGNIAIDSSYFLASPGSVVEASSQLGVSGTITVTAPVVDVGAGLGVLPAGFFDATRLLREACTSRAGESENSFVVVGRGSMPESAWGAYSSARPRPAAAPCGGDVR